MFVWYSHDCSTVLSTKLRTLTLMHQPSEPCHHLSSLGGMGRGALHILSILDTLTDHQLFQLGHYSVGARHDTERRVGASSADNTRSDLSFID